MRIFKQLITALLTGLLAVSLLACEQEGPAERAGESVDETMEETGEQMEDTGERFNQ